MIMLAIVGTKPPTYLFPFQYTIWTLVFEYLNIKHSECVPSFFFLKRFILVFKYYIKKKCV